MDSNKIKTLLVMVIALFGAVYLGISAATAQFATIAWVLGGISLVTCLALERSIWLLIPFAAALGIGLRIPGQPDSLLLAQIVVIGFSTLLFLMRRLPHQIHLTELEFWLIVLVLLVGQVYLRNPVSIRVFGGDTVGGKGYILFTIGTVSALLLSSLRVPEKELRWILPLGILGGCLNTAVAVIGHLIPAVAYYTGADFVSTDTKDYSDAGVAVDTGAATRIGLLSTLGRNLALWVCSFKSPIRACFHPIWGGLILLSLAAVMFGGFRNGVAAVGMTYLVAIAYRNGIGGIFMALFGGAAAIGLLAFTNLVAPLPPNVQRTLTFLPGTWEQRYRDDAESSTEWRLEVWKEALLTDRWIQNKILGDGLGFTAAELAAQMNNRQGGRVGFSGFDAHRETILSNGDYHSGPVSMIRTIGYVGLIFFLIAQLRLAVHAHRQIIRCRDTPWLPLALFIGIPLIWAPVFFIFIFGDFKLDVVTLFLGIGMVRLLENNLPLPEYVRRRRSPYMLQRPEQRLAGEQALPQHAIR